MASSSSYVFHILILHIITIPNFNCVSQLGFVSASADNEGDFVSFHGDYSPPSPPPPSPPPHPPSVSCEEDLMGVGSLDTSCEVSSSLNFTDDVYIEGIGNFYILPGVRLSCPVKGCSILVNISGEFRLGFNAEMIAGTVSVVSRSAILFNGSVINVTALAGQPPEQTSGTPAGVQGAGGGHGGRGASCVMDNTKLPEDVWGGDAYSWASLGEPWSYGSQGGTTNREENYGGKGGGRIGFYIKGAIEVHGSFLADGGDGGIKGGGGSGGSIYIKSPKMSGSGKISASGGNGFAGGGGGRVSVNVFSRHDDPKFLVHGGRSYGCPGNSGAAGTFYDAVPRRLIVSNHNMSTDTDTLLLEFPNQPLWTNVYIQDHARATVPLLWSRVQVQGQFSLSCGAVLSFGLAHYALSEFELMAEELLMSDSTIKVYGALRMAVKIHLMLNSKILIDGDGDAIVATSLLEASNLVVLKESSVIHSNANLGVHGQGFMNLSGPGDVIEAQRLVLSLFYSISVGPGSILRGPLENASNNYVTPRLYCELQDCPKELLHPPEDCNLNSSLSFTLQICRVEDISVEGFIDGSVIHFHWVRTVFVQSPGAISASGLGCKGGVGRGRFLSNGLGGGGGHGGKGGSGYYNGSVIKGGDVYGNADFPCELGSGSGNESLAGATSGGGVIVMGSLEHSLSSLSIDGSLRADGESFEENVGKQGVMNIGPGGGSGGTILLFIHALALGESSSISTVGGHGGHNGGGGGGGRVHFHWSDISIGDEYLPIASVNGTIHVGGGLGIGDGNAGENGTVTGKSCPKGLYGIFCQECPVGTYKNVSGSDRALCRKCPSHELSRRAIYVAVRGGVADAPCPYKCISERYHMPHCYTTLEELIYTFGGPWLFGFILLVLLVLLALVLSVARMKFVNSDELPSLVPAQCGLQIDRSFPFLESLNEVMETSRTEESQTHVHRMYFMGPNTFSEPWHLPYSPPEQVIEIVYEDAFNTFVDEINALAAYQWWEGSVYSILSILAYPLAWSWLQWRRKNKIQQLREFVRSEYDHACLRSCRSRALYEGLKVAATSDLMLGYVDFFLGGDEKRADLPPRLQQRFPMSLLFGGDGSYMAPFSLHSDNILTSLMSQSVPPTIWYRLVAGLNAQLRLVRHGHLRTSFCLIMNWLETHANPTLSPYGVHVDLACFQPVACGYRQFGLTVHSVEDESTQPSVEEPNVTSLAEQQSCLINNDWRKAVDDSSACEHLLTHKSIGGGILQIKILQTLEEKKTLCYPLSFILHNTKPIGHQDLVGLVISILLLGDFSLVLLTLLQLYSISLLDFFLFLFILPLGILLPFPAGINALFSHGPRRSAGLARVYALWNITSLINVVVGFICGFVHYKIQSSSNKKHQNFQSWNFSMDESGWWMLSSGLVLCKVIQAQLINYHVANLEIQDRTLYSNVPYVFWQRLAASSASSTEVSPDPFGREAKHFTEIRVLNRDVRIVLEGVDKFSNLIGSVYYPDGESAKDLALELIENGLAKYVEWSASMMEEDAKRQLKSAELQAKKTRLRIWTNYIPPATNSKAIHDQNFTGKVVEVVSGDCIIVADDSVPYGSPLAERRVNLSSIRCPKMGNPRRDEKPAPYAREAKDLLRQRLIGRQVNVQMEYSRKVIPSDAAAAAGGPTDSRVMDFGSVFLPSPGKGEGDDASTPAPPTGTNQQAGLNVAELLVSRGYGTVIRHRDFEERSNYYDALLSAESRAIAGKKGIHSNKDSAPMHIADLTVGSEKETKDFLPFLQRKRLPAVVEYVLSGHRFILFVPKETCSIAFSFSGVRCPAREEPFSDEAIALMRRKIMQRDVKIEVATVDRTGTFLGSLWESKTNMAVTLLEAGLAKLQMSFGTDWIPDAHLLMQAEQSAKRQKLKAKKLLEAGLAKLQMSFGTDRIPDAHLLMQAEQSAKRQKLKIWENFVEGEEVSNGAVAERKHKEELKVTVTEVLGGGKFYAEVVGDQKVSSIQQQLASLSIQEAPVIGAFNPKKGDIVLAKFSADDSWNRAMIVNAPQAAVQSPKDKFEVFYIDYGNQEVVPYSDLRPLDPSVSSALGSAQLCSLAYVKIPSLEEDYGQEAAVHLSEHTLNGPKEFKAVIEERDTSGGKVKGQGTGTILMVTLIDTETNSSINAALLKCGLARLEKRKRWEPKQKQAALDELEKFQEEAKSKRLGMWEYGDMQIDDEDVGPPIRKAAEKR